MIEIHILRLRRACEGVEVYICQAFTVRMATSDHDIAVRISKNSCLEDNIHCAVLNWIQLLVVQFVLC